MEKLLNIFKKNSVTTSQENSQLTSRRDFFKKTGIFSAIAAASLAPIALRADDDAIMHHPKWGQSWALT